MFKRAIVRIPNRSIIQGITTANLGTPEYDLAIDQHRKYIDSLKTCGLEIFEIPPDENYPDGCFIEDTAIVNEKIAIIARPGAPTRRGEIDDIEQYLRKYFKEIKNISDPGTVEGGDVLRIENNYYIGISARTNKNGAEQLSKILENYGFNCILIPLKQYLHLKTGVNYLGDNTILVAGEFINHPSLSKYSQIIVNSDEEYAANSLRINEYIITPAGFPKTHKKLLQLNKKIITLQLSEFHKLDGGLSCLSIRF